MVRPGGGGLGGNNGCKKFDGRCRNFRHELSECRMKLKKETKNTEMNKEQQMGKINQAPTNEFIKAKEMANRRV
ncbi:hypothetical protein RDI58_024434 [Solanum bulbocastanum]|uniref:Uncharacterized protein n=1 Tax=Solanum bulbocastanum TaxID=147425 RepID=A0AAN8Y3M6_SOLBU